MSVPAQITVLNASGVPVNVNAPLDPGRAAATDSRPTAACTEDYAAIGAPTETPPASDTASSGLNGRLQRVAQRITSLIALVPAALGQATKAGSLAVTVASDDDLQGKLGALTETAPATDTASSGLNGRLQRIAQRLTSLIALVPTSLGTKTAANSLAVTLASDGQFVTSIGTSSSAVVANGAAGDVSGYLRTIKDAATDTTTVSPVKIDQTTPGTTDGVSVAHIASTAVASGNGTASAGCQRVTIASDNTAFAVTATTTPATAAHALIPAPSTYRVLSAAATTNGANIKGSAGTVKGIQGFNAKASAVYLKLYNKASSPTVGTDTPVKTIYLPASAAFAFDFGTGVAFATGIGIALTGAGADADTTALSSGDILALNVDYH